MLAGYQTSEAMAGAANSYGGINTQTAYLQPRSGVGRVGGGVAPVAPAGGSGSGTGTTDSGNGGSTEPSGGGSTGGGENPPVGDEG